MRSHDVASKDNRARVSFAPGTKNKYIVVAGEHDRPHPADNGLVYDDLETAILRCEWLNWNTGSKTAGKYTHPREEEAAKRAEARAQLIEAHRALTEGERYGPVVAKQLAALRAERAREEQDAEQFELWAGQDSRTVKARREYRKSAQQARKRAEGLGKKIDRLEATPPLPSRLAGAAGKEKEGGVRASPAPAGASGQDDAQSGGAVEAAS